MVLHGHEDWVWGVAWSPEGKRLATVSDDRTARIWDTEVGTERWSCAATRIGFPVCPGPLLVHT